jgi:glycogen synthase
MKILILSLPFPPSTGGTESVSTALAEGFVNAGHEVCLISETPAEAGYDTRFPHRVLRNIGRMEVLREVKHCDVFLHNSISLRYAWPLLLCPRRWIVAQHTWLVNPGQKSSFSSRIKLFTIRFARVICVSRAIATQFDNRATVIGNPYSDALFRIIPAERRSNDLFFVGNLGVVKGVDILLRALSLLVKRRVPATLTIVGDGPEEARLKALSEELGLSPFVRFLGALRGEDLAREYNRHTVSAVPSQWLEPFGVVALEAIACGCIVVGSNGGGLADAIGPVGLTFPNGNVDALADALQSALKEETYLSLRKHAAAHLEKHKAQVVANRYLEVMKG